MEKIKPLTKKQKDFAKAYVETASATQAVLKTYNTKDYNSAQVIGSQNIIKPHIQREIIKLMDSPEIGLDDKSLLIGHLSLLNKKETIVKNNMTTGEIEVIPTGQIDTQAVGKALDMAYKIKGHYVNERNENNTPVNIAFIVNNYEK